MAEAKIEFILYKKEDKSVENEKKPNPPIHLSDLFKSTAYCDIFFVLNKAQAKHSKQIFKQA
jgi:hypothetical protein